jgi:hypothetical protein
MQIRAALTAQSLALFSVNKKPFSRDANDYVSKIGSKIVLIDGSRLAELMIEFGVAVATDATYTVKRIDNDFFESISFNPARFIDPIVHLSPVGFS